MQAYAPAECLRRSKHVRRAAHTGAGACLFCVTGASSSPVCMTAVQRWGTRSSLAAIWFRNVCNVSTRCCCIYPLYPHFIAFVNSPAGGPNRGKLISGARSGGPCAHFCDVTHSRSSPACHTEGSATALGM